MVLSEKNYSQDERTRLFGNPQDNKEIEKEFRKQARIVTPPPTMDEVGRISLVDRSYEKDRSVVDFYVKSWIPPHKQIMHLILYKNGTAIAQYKPESKEERMCGDSGIMNGEQRVKNLLEILSHTPKKIMGRKNGNKYLINFRLNGTTEQREWNAMDDDDVPISMSEALKGIEEFYNLVPKFHY